MPRLKSKSKKIGVLSNFLIVILMVGILSFLYYGLSFFFSKPNIQTITTHPQPVETNNNLNQNINTRLKHPKELFKHNAMPFGHSIKRSAINTHDLRRTRAITACFLHNMEQIPLFKLVEPRQISIEL